jgi:branched-chain amino acid transport system ATP-binding protein
MTTQAETTGAAPVIETRGVGKRFEGLVAVEGVDFTVQPRSIVSLIGPNGAGKTTFFNILTGLYRATSGQVLLGQKDVTRTRPDRLTALGLARTFQNIRLFESMSALENVMVAQHARTRTGLAGAVLRTPRVRREERVVLERAREELSYVGLAPALHGMLATKLSYGDQRRVEIARALASDPRLLLLDEPTAGMNPQESEALTHFIRRLRDERDIAVVIIEHDMKVVMDVSERVTVLERGRKIAEGTAYDVRNDARVIEAYLGSAAEQR